MTVDVEAVGYGSDYDDRGFEGWETPMPNSKLGESIFSQEIENRPFRKDAKVNIKNLMDLVLRIQEIETRGAIRPMVNGSVEFEAEIEFGGKDGAQFKGSASGKVQDNEGNSGQAKIQVDQSGKTKIGVSGKKDFKESAKPKK